MANDELHDAGKCDPDTCTMCWAEQDAAERAAATPQKKKVYRFTFKAGDAIQAQFIDDDGLGVLAQLETFCRQIREASAAGDELPELNIAVETGAMTEEEFAALPNFDDGAV